MSLVDDFDAQRQSACFRAFDRESARRQFRMSLLLVAAMAVAAIVLSAALPTYLTESATPVAESFEIHGRLVSVDG
jgi:hypothetical protein